MNLVIGLLIPFLGTTLGSAMVFFMRKEVSPKIEKILLGFASGVMIAASIWSLIIPSIEMAEEQGKISWLPATIGFMLGIIFLLYSKNLRFFLYNKVKSLWACMFAKQNAHMAKPLFLLILDKITSHIPIDENKIAKNKKTNMLVLAVTLHNIPEGMAVGVTFAGALLANSGITMAAAIALAIGIGIQNFPEGAIISLPLKGEGVSKPKAFLYGMLSGIVEPIAAIITILLTNFIVPMLPYLLAFAAGAMIYVVVEELIPESQAGKHTEISTLGVAIGFVLMMILDVTLN